MQNVAAHVVSEESQRASITFIFKAFHGIPMNMHEDMKLLFAKSHHWSITVQPSNLLAATLQGLKCGLSHSPLLEPFSSRFQGLAMGPPGYQADVLLLSSSPLLCISGFLKKRYAANLQCFITIPSRKYSLWAFRNRHPRLLGRHHHC